MITGVDNTGSLIGAILQQVPTWPKINMPTNTIGPRTSDKTLLYSYRGGPIIRVTDTGLNVSRAHHNGYNFDISHPQHAIDLSLDDNTRSAIHSGVIQGVIGGIL